MSITVQRSRRHSKPYSKEDALRGASVEELNGQKRKKGKKERERKRKKEKKSFSKKRSQIEIEKTQNNTRFIACL